MKSVQLDKDTNNQLHCYSEYGYMADKLVHEIKLYLEREEKQYFCLSSEVVFLHMFGFHNLKYYVTDKGVKTVNIGHYSINENIEFRNLKTGKLLKLHGCGYMSFFSKLTVRGIPLTLDILKLVYILFIGVDNFNIYFDNITIDFKEGLDLDLNNLNANQLDVFETNIKKEISSKKKVIVEWLEQGLLEDRRFYCEEFSQVSNEDDLLDIDNNTLDDMLLELDTLEILEGLNENDLDICTGVDYVSEDDLKPVNTETKSDIVCTNKEDKETIENSSNISDIKTGACKKAEYDWVYEELGKIKTSNECKNGYLKNIIDSIEKINDISKKLQIL